ncbi:MAG: 4-hydroxy-tetrahydrodipicolinate synthase [Archaeoglobi archaeon]|nr:4-hydroxy-tetrahydrodipicolinate synthase [Archaeoglobi archaeon]
MKKFEGIIVPMVTPFDKDGKLDEEKLRKLVDFLIDGGVHGVFPLASLGEFYTMTEEEKRRTIEIVVDQTNGRVPVIPGVGYTGTEIAKKLGEYAKDVGCDAILAVAPYYAVQNSESLYQYYEDLSKVGLPLFSYNIPQFVGYSIPVETVLKLAHEGIICGLKDSSGDMMYFAAIAAEVPDDFSLLQGQDIALLPSLAVGAEGGMVGTPNVVPEYTVEIYNSFKKGDLQKALEYQKKLAKLVKVVGRGVFPAGLKYAGELLGAPVGYPRRPTDLSEADKEFIKSVLKELGLIS